MSERLVAVKKVVAVLYAHCALCTVSVGVHLFKEFCYYCAYTVYLSRVILTKHFA
jgi:hypothetical protein